MRPSQKGNRTRKEETVYTIHLDIELDKEVWEKEKRRTFCFVLVTTVPIEWQDETMDRKEILALFKGQVNVEMNFSFLKDPFFTDEIYVKKLEQVLVLEYLFLLMLVVYRGIPTPGTVSHHQRMPIEGPGKAQVDETNGSSYFSSVCLCASRRPRVIEWAKATKIRPIVDV